MLSRLLYLACAIVFALSLIIGACCKKEDIDSNIASTTLVKSDFPIKVGNYWRYMRGDDVLEDYDTVVFSIVYQVGNDSFYTETFNVNRQEKVDSGYIVFNELAISYKTSNNAYNSCFSSFTIELPCELGSTWPGNLGYDSITYTSPLPETAFWGKRYYNSHKLFQKGSTAGNAKFVQGSLNFKKGIGFIAYNVILKGHSSFPTGAVMYLMDYKLE
jgi:hypothetical protein